MSDQEKLIAELRSYMDKRHFPLLEPRLEDVIISFIAERDAKLKEKIEKLIDENDDGMWSGRETADTILDFLFNTESYE